jgi:hypothetical protein
MTHYLRYLVFVGAAVQLTGVSWYAWGTIRGRIKPNRVSWIMWAAAPLIAASASVTKGAGLAAVPVFVSGGGSLLVLAASFANKGAYWKLGRLDYACGGFSILALVFWTITREPNVAIVFSILSSAASAVPSLIKSWRHPETESISTYVTGLFNGLTSFAALNRVDFASLAFPIWLVIFNVNFIIPLARKRLVRD